MLNRALGAFAAQRAPALAGQAPQLSSANAEARERGSQLGLLDAGICEQGPVVERLSPHDLGEPDGGLADALIVNVRIDHREECSNFFDELRCDGPRNQVWPAAPRSPGSKTA